MRRADVRELLENVGVWLEAIGGNITLGEEGEAVIDDVVSIKTRPLGYFAGFEGLKHSMSGRMRSASIAAIASSRV